MDVSICDGIDGVIMLVFFLGELFYDYSWEGANGVVGNVFVVLDILVVGNLL